MQRTFTRGMLIGSIIGASLGMIMKNSEMMNPRARKRMMKTGRTFIRKSGNIISDVVDIFR